MRVPADKLGEIEDALNALLARPLNVEHLRALVRALDELVATERAARRAYALFLRARAGAHLMTHCEDVGAAADRAMADALEAVGLLRDLALLGDEPLRQLLGQVLQLLTRIAAARPDLRYSDARQVEHAVHGSLLVTVGDEELASTAASLAHALANVALDPERRNGETTAYEAVETGERWVDAAVARLDAVAPPCPAWLITEIAWAVTKLAIVDVAEAEQDEAVWERRFAVLGRRWQQLSLLADRLVEARGDSEPEAERVQAGDALHSAEAALLQATMGAIDRLATRIDQDEPLAAFGDVTALRGLIREIPTTTWDRTRAAELIDRPMSPDPEDPRGGAQELLDRVEANLLMIALSAVARALSKQPLDELEHFVPELGPNATVEELVSSLTVAFVCRATPRPAPGHLAAALHRMGNARPLPELERELVTALERTAPGRRLPVGTVAETLELWSVVLQWSPTSTVTTVVAELDRFLADVCLPLAAESRSRGARTAGLAFHAAATAVGGSTDGARQLLERLDATTADLRQLGEHSPVLDLTRAQLAFVLAQSDGSWWPQVRSSATAVVRHIDNDADLPAPRSLFDPDALIESLRLAALAAFAAVPTADTQTAAESTDRLRALAENAALEPSERERAATAAQEIAIVERLHANDDLAVVAADWTSLIDRRPASYLIGLVRAASDGLAPPIDPALVARAVQNLLDAGPSLRRRSAAQAGYLDLLTSSPAAGVLALDGDQQLRLGRLAVEVLDTDSAAAADVAFRVVLNLQPFVYDSVVSSDVRRLIEDVAERYLPAALRDPEAAPALAAFLDASASAALNFGAMRQIEHAHRMLVAFAAYLLAHHQGNADMAALCAYKTAEFLRLSNNLDVAERWFAIYDRWVADGGLSDERFAELRAGIAHDRDQLRAALRQRAPTGE